MTHETATVETLAAEVRVMMIGKRQVTLSVVRQLDVVRPDDVEPFGRVSHPSFPQFHPKTKCLIVFVVGRSARDGSLVVSRAFEGGGLFQSTDLFEAWLSLPLIVLAGLR